MFNSLLNNIKPEIDKIKKIKNHIALHFLLCPYIYLYNDPNFANIVNPDHTAPRGVGSIIDYS